MTVSSPGVDEARELAMEGVRAAAETARPRSAHADIGGSGAGVHRMDARRGFPARPSTAVAAQRNTRNLHATHRHERLSGWTSSGARPTSARLQERIARSLVETHGGVGVTTTGDGAPGSPRSRTSPSTNLEARQRATAPPPPRVAFGRGVESSASGPAAQANALVRLNAGGGERMRPSSARVFSSTGGGGNGGAGVQTRPTSAAAETRRRMVMPSV